jgi:hypothetical protein
LLTYSQDWTNAAWVKTNATITAAATASPDGTVNAQRLAATTASATLVNTAAIPVAATSATFSVYAKQGTGPTTGNTFALRNNTTATNLVLGTLNYSTGVWTYNIGSTGVTVTNAGNGWWRIQISATAGITSGDTLIGYVGWGGATPAAGDHLFAYGAQLEAGAFATSYIPTVASTVSRSADVATMTGTNFSTWYNQSEGTFVAEASKYANVDGYAFTADAGSAANLVGGGVLASGAGFSSINAGGVAQAFQSVGSIAPNSVFKIAVAAATNNANVAANGAVATTDTTVTMPIVDRLQIGSYVGVSTRLNGHIRAIAYYNTRLPNTSLQTLTAPSLASPLALDFISPTYTVGY